MMVPDRQVSSKEIPNACFALTSFYNIVVGWLLCFGNVGYSIFPSLKLQLLICFLSNKVATSYRIQSLPLIDKKIFLSFGRESLKHSPFFHVLLVIASFRYDEPDRFLFYYALKLVIKESSIYREATAFCNQTRQHELQCSCRLLTHDRMPHIQQWLVFARAEPISQPPIYLRSFFLDLKMLSG